MNVELLAVGYQVSGVSFPEPANVDTVILFYDVDSLFPIALYGRVNHHHRKE